jgi:hypothetical protein
MAANQVDFKILPSDQFSVYSPQTRSDKVITYFTLLSKLRGDILSVGQDDDPNDIVSAFYSSVGGTQTLHLVKADGSEITASTPEQIISGTVNFVSKFTTANDIGDSQIFDNGTNVGIGTTSMTHKLQLGTGGVFADYYQLDTTYSNGFVIGAISWDIDNGTADIGLSSNLKLKIGQDDVWYVKNQSGSTITKGTVVYASGTLGASGRITIAPMIADGTIPSRFLLGVVAESILNGADGYVIAKGKIRQINTNAFNDGDVLWVSPTVAGTLTATEPTAPNLKLAIAFVVHKATNGIIAVRVTTGTRIADASDVEYAGAADNSFLVYNSATGVWEDEAVSIFKTIAVAGQSSVVADTYTDTLTLAAGTNVTITTNATTDTITINSTDQFVGTVTSVATTAPITGGTITATGTIGITQSGAAADGYLSSTDWTTFNSKQSALTFSAPLVNTSGTVSIPAATSLVDGYLSATDFATFNGKQDALTLTTTGTTGAATLIGATLNIPNYADQFVGTVTSVDLTAGTGITVSGGPITTSGSITVNNSDRGSSQNIFKNIAVAGQSTIVADLNDDTLTVVAGSGVTITTNDTTDTITISATGSGGSVTSVATTAPITGGTITTTGTIGITQSGVSTDGYLSSTDWGTFNSKQPQLNGTGFVKASGTTISYDNSTYYLASNPSGFTTNTGTVTSVNLTAGARIEVAGGPITTSGSITVTHGVADGADFTTAQAFEARVLADGGIFEALGEVAIAIGSLEDAASPSSTDFNDGVVIQNVAIDEFGHLLGVGVTDLDDRYAQLGLGTTNFLAKWSSPSELVTSIASDNGTGIGIGISSASYKLEVSGDIKVSSGSIGVGVNPNTTDGRIDASNDIVAFQTSDRRLKENITPITNALEKVKSLTGVMFDWKEETKSVHGYEGHDVGIIAQDVQAVLPEAVRTNDTGYLSVRYEKMIALLIEANKELAARVEELESKLK